MINEIFPDQNANKFYSQLAELGNMAKSPYANLFIDSILGATAQWAYEHRDAIEKLQALAPAQNPQPQPDGALDPKAQAEPSPCSADKNEAPDIAPAGDRATDQDCSAKV